MLRIFRISLILLVLLLPLSIAHAQTADEIQAKIDQRNQDIADLQKEIAGYQSQIDSLGTQASSLSSTLKSLDLTQKQLAAKIEVTQNQIAAKNLDISQLGGQIDDKEDSIADDDRIITQSLLTIDQTDDSSLIEIALSSNSIAGSIQELDQLAQVQKSLVDRIASLRSDKADLEDSKTRSESDRADLTGLASQLTAQQAIVQSTSKEQSDLLKQTNQSEASYKALLATKQAQYNAMQQEILDYDAQLKLIVSPSSISSDCSRRALSGLSPRSASRSTSAIRTSRQPIRRSTAATATTASTSQPRSASPVMAALSGEVVGVAQHRQLPGLLLNSAKWIMIKHANGLSTLYAHLSLQSVKVGDTVETGQIIGYSGNTGYTTGPHLHFGVYATQGVQITLFHDQHALPRRCSTHPAFPATLDAYLNPLSYLPPLSGGTTDEGPASLK